MTTYSLNGKKYKNEQDYIDARNSFFNSDSDESKGMASASFKDGSIAFSELNANGTGGIYIFSGSIIVKR